MYEYVCLLAVGGAAREDLADVEGPCGPLSKV
jgi:hypothetical protein